MKMRAATQANVGKSVEELEKRNDILEEKKSSVVEEPAFDKTLRDKERLKEVKNSHTAEAFIAVNLRLTPDNDGDILAVLHPGIKVDVHDVDYAPEWYGLTYQGRNCFVKREFIKIL